MSGPSQIPDHDLILETYRDIRLRRENQSRLEWGAMEKDLTEYMHSSDSLDRRKGWREDGCPRFLYKYRSIAGADAKTRLEDVLLGHQLWMADRSKYEDSEDSEVHYKVTLRGEELHWALVAQQRRAAIVSRFKAEKMVDKRISSNAQAVEQNLRRIHEQILSRWGICSLAANARGEQLWQQYGGVHAGICIQFDPVRDFKTFVDLQKITYSDEPRVIVNPFPNDQVTARRFDLLMTKRRKYSFEDEWRLVGGDKANKQLSFLPEALTAVVLGACASSSTQAAVVEMLSKRFVATRLPVKLYKAQISQNGIRIFKVQ